MNRRGFLGAMIRAGVAAMALPAATTYARIWVPKREIVPVEIIPFWTQTSRHVLCHDDGYAQAFVEAFFWKKPMPEHLKSVGPLYGWETTP